MYDPTPGWRPVSSYVAPVPPPSTEPEEAPLVCFSLNQEWVKYVLGSLQQLCQPTTWDVADYAALIDVLARVQKLLSRVGAAEACMDLEIRLNTETCIFEYSVDGGTTWLPTGTAPDTAACFTGPAGEPGTPGAPGTPASNPLLRLNSGNCQLEESYDDGDSWTAVSGWSALAGCLVPDAPNPRGDATAQHACNIAGYLATEVIQLAIAKAVADYNDAKSAIQFALDVMGVVPGINIVARVAAIALYGLYSVITGGNIADYTDASTNADLLSNVICAIYLAIKADGEVKASNFAALLTNLAGITYAHSEVITSIHDFVNDLGVDGIRAIQAPGAIAVYDCSGCEAPAGCSPLVATAVATNCTFTSSGFTNLSRFKVNAGGTYYAGVLGVDPAGAGSPITFTLRAKMHTGAGRIALYTSMGNGGPQPGDNAWVDHLDAELVCGLVSGSFHWYVESFGAIDRDGAGGTATSVLELRYDPTGGTIKAYIDGVQVGRDISAGLGHYKPALVGFYTDEELRDVEVCT